MERIPIKTQPKLFDKVVARWQNYLADELFWLNHSFGLCEHLTDTKDGKKFKSANLYIGRGQYEQIMPCEELGNFCFWILRDTEEILTDTNIVKAPFSLIFWYNVEKVSSSPDERNREAVKAQILGALKGLKAVDVQFTKVYERAENVFSDFSYDFTENQYMMFPYAALRIDGTISASIPCYHHGIVGDGDFNNSYNDDYDA